MSLHFKIDTESCIQCGSCAKDCPYNIIEMDDDYPKTNPGKEAKCIQC
ncbi:MAG: nitroreductase, partial [Desulfobulbaceae bacterium]|nr:nitroreductase [Desulfobulbaceae bacterium]